MLSDNPIVTVTVESVFPFGVFVRLEDNTRAYIRRRELTLTGDVDPGKVTTIGMQLKAAIIELPTSGHIMELSVRKALPDPWLEFFEKHKPGDTVIAVIRQIETNRFFAQIMPGVDGLILSTDLAPWEIMAPEDFLWVGDIVEAIITQVDKGGRRVRLSIRDRVEQLTQFYRLIERLSLDRPPAAILENSPGHSSSLQTDIDESKPINLPGPVVVVEDYIGIRGPLVKILTDLKCETREFASAVDALVYCQEQDFVILLTDLDLPELNGFDFIRRLRSMGKTFPIAVLSEPTLIAEHLHEIESLGIVAVFHKPLEPKDIYDFLRSINRGEMPVVKIEDWFPKTYPEFLPFKKLADNMRSNQPLKARIQQGLTHFFHDNRIEKGIVFFLDPMAQNVSIIAQVGEISIIENAIHGLIRSPVKDVILGQSVIWENQATSANYSMFKNILDLLPFESCVGVPIQIGECCNHCLFLFHRKVDAFPRNLIREAITMATLCSAALESHILDERIQATSRIFLSGQLSAAFSHELFNQISGLDMQFTNLRTDIIRLSHESSGSLPSSALTDIQQSVDTLGSVVSELKKTILGFRRLMEIREDRSADVNQVLRQAKIQLQALSKRSRVQVEVPSDTNDLTLVAGSSTSLNQVFLNLMLNAIQHMELITGHFNK